VPVLLVATPDPLLRTQLMDDATTDGVDVTDVTCGPAVSREIMRRSYDLVVLDDRLPDTNVRELIQAVTRRRGGVLVVTSDASELNIVLLMELGADDVVVRPFSTPELNARIHAILRRRSPGRRPTPEELVTGPICLHVASRLVTVRGERMHIPRLEFAVLLALQTRDGVPVSRGILLEECWSPQTTRRPEYVDAVIRRLRVRLELQPSRPQHLLTVRSKGYALRP
jgi:two-component system response regulator RegX3